MMRGHPLRGALCLSSCFAIVLPGVGQASVLGDLADQCMAAIEAGDMAAFEMAADAIRERDDVFDAEARLKAEDCLSLGYGERWEYWAPADEWQATSAIQARMKTTADAKSREERAAIDAQVEAERLEAERQANSARVAAMVYASCTTLLARDQVAAMTSSVCVDSFLANGLPLP